MFKRGYLVGEDSSSKELTDCLWINNPSEILYFVDNKGTRCSTKLYIISTKNFIARAF